MSKWGALLKLLASAHYTYMRGRAKAGRALRRLSFSRESGVFVKFAFFQLTTECTEITEGSALVFSVALVAIFFARREDSTHGGTGILSVRTAKMAVPRLVAALPRYRTSRGLLRVT